MPIRIWATSQDGLWSVIEGFDYPPGIGRSRTRDTPGDALTAQWEPALVTPPGLGSLKKFVLVRTMDLPHDSNGRIGKVVSPKSYIGKTIPDYPHKCLICGGRMLVLFSSTEHEGGACPGPPKKANRWV